MGLHKRKDSPFWQASYMVEYPDGRKDRKYESLETKNKRDAEIKYAERLKSIDDGSYFDKPKCIPTVTDIINRYVKEAVIHHKPSSQNRERSIARNLVMEFENKLVSELTKSELSKYKAKRLSGELKFGKGNSKRIAGEAGLRKELSFLRAVWNKAIDDWDDDYDGYFAKHTLNPARRAMKGLEDTARVRYLSQKESEALRDNLPLWLVPIIVAAVDTGLRQANIVHLRVSEVDLDKKILNIPGQVTKNGAPLPKKMTDRLHAFIENAIKNRKVKSPYVFIQSDGRPNTCGQVSIAFRRACKKAGIEDLHFHDLRHDFATFLINNGASLHQVQIALGQKDLRSAERYAHLLPENLNVTDRFGDSGSGAIIADTVKQDVLTQVLTLAG